jgi:hypothetical protein
LIHFRICVTFRCDLELSFKIKVTPQHLSPQTAQKRANIRHKIKRWSSKQQASPLTRLSPSTALAIDKKYLAEEITIAVALVACTTRRCTSFCGITLQMQLRRERIEEKRKDEHAPEAILMKVPARNRLSLLHWLHAPQDDALPLQIYFLEIHLRRERTNTMAQRRQGKSEP